MPIAAAFTRAASSWADVIERRARSVYRSNVIRSLARRPTSAAARRPRPCRSGPRRGGSRAGTSSASPTTGPGRDAEELHHLVAVERRAGSSSSSSCSRSSAMRASSSSMRRASAARLARVARRAVAARQLVELVEQRARRRARSGAPRCRSSPCGTCGTAGAGHELRHVVDDVVRVAQREQPLAAPCARRPPRGGGTSRRCRSVTARARLADVVQQRGEPHLQLAAASSRRPRSCARARPCGGGSGPVRAASR